MYSILLRVANNSRTNSEYWTQCGILSRVKEAPFLPTIKPLPLICVSNRSEHSDRHLPFVCILLSVTSFAVAQVDIVYIVRNIFVTNYANSSLCMSLRRIWLKNVNEISHLQYRLSKLPCHIYLFWQGLREDIVDFRM